MNNRIVRIVLYALLLAGTITFAWKFKMNYDRLTQESAQRYHEPLEESDFDSQPNPSLSASGRYRLGLWGLGLVLSMIGLGFFAAQDLSQLFSSRTIEMLYDDEGEPLITEDYEKAEEEWNLGNYLEALRLMREYLEKNPREQHVALRIAEIYEKDLNNPLAAALEYEEILERKLPRERWGWAAVHLCNLYTSRLGQPEKAIALLRRIDTEYGDTAAAEKARSRLAQLRAEGFLAAAEPTPDEPPRPRPSLPPGFRRKKT